MHANDGFRELDRSECLRLLAQAPVGRVVYTRQALPAVLLVNFALDGGAVVVRTSAASEFVRAVDGAVVSFEADEVDAVARSGWSVIVTGRAALVTEQSVHAHLLRSGPRPWVSWPTDVFIRIEPELVTGRELAGGVTVQALGLSP
ncbi:pyridoxamine 5'-phosphate oxidase family protein [Streptomyces fructofermentans]|uniref:DNA-binding protein n=1 Tax=Streptomyces fructofermentans TaxID=152141 RepID=A0A918KUR5_9ACTN|nr:pyridoxamine 5'-phosphate oxidase family protein [Streptomyces fructofermentans]GGX76958.1 DNA-binding protein [Streptomyces fructofermentans]